MIPADLPFPAASHYLLLSVELYDLVDLRRLDEGDWDELWHDWREDWRHLKFDQHIEPPTWVLSDLVRDCEHTGIVFPSQRSRGRKQRGRFTDRLGEKNMIRVNDPGEQLPKNQSSWNS